MTLLKWPVVSLVFLSSAVHYLLLLVNKSYPQSMLNADRIDHRLKNIEAFSERLQSGGAMDYLANHGSVVGDYLYSAMLFANGGLESVVVGQSLLAILSVLVVYKIALVATKNVRLAWMASLIYLLLPHALAFPHVLSAEAFFTPFIIFGFYFLALDWDKPTLKYVFYAGLMFGLAQTVRPNILPWILVLLAWLAIRQRGKQSLGTLLCASLLPTLVFYAMVFVQNGNFNTGNYSSGLQVNLYHRFKFTIAPLPKDQRLALKKQYLTRTQAEQMKMPALNYLSFMFNEPALSIKHTVRDMMNFIPKSGITRVAVDLLPHFAAQRKKLFDAQTGWRRVMERDGLPAAIKFVYSEAPGLVSLALLFSLLFLALLGCAVMGVVALIRNHFDTKANHLFLGLLALFPAYVFISGQMISAMQTRHRFPSEFVIALFASVGLAYCHALWKQRVHKSHPLPTQTSAQSMSG